MKKILSYILIIVVVIILLIITLFFINNNKENNINNEENTIDDEVVELLAIDDTDENVIGYITIEKIGLEKAPIAEGTDNSVIKNYVGHFEGTSYLDGNVCLCSHNRGGSTTSAYFGNLKNLDEGDLITYITKYETKTYEVREIKQIEETDLTVLEQTEENKITLITCIENQSNLRLCVVGVEVGGI